MTTTKTKKQQTQELIAQEEERILAEKKAAGTFRRQAMKSLRQQGKLETSKGKSQKEKEPDTGSKTESSAQVSTSNISDQTPTKKEPTHLKAINERARTTRKEGESWGAALKRASAEIKEEKATSK